MHGVMRGAMHCLFVVFIAQAGQSLLPPGGPGGLNKAAPKHLTLSTTASPASPTTPGSGVSLFLDVTPNPGIHVYAPGANDYLPIRLTLEPLADLAIGKTIYPKSETMIFERERVPVFQKPFRLVEQVTIARTATPGTTMTIRGLVNYQACDDKVCFIPASAPVTWTLTVR
jgi:DsbC/DsbD-like thiol-disulfide interchange protein